jgi:hypothetical protein
VGYAASSIVGLLIMIGEALEMVDAACDNLRRMVKMVWRAERYYGSW